MKEKNTDGKGRRGRRFCEAVDGPIVRRLYARMPTAELARLMGMTVKQVENFIYRNKTKGKPCKDPDYLSKIRSECGKKGGRPRKKIIK